MLFCFLIIVNQGCAATNDQVVDEIDTNESVVVEEKEPIFDDELENGLVEDKENELDLSQYITAPTQWGENVTGVKRRLATEEKVIALTFDACGGPNGNMYDEELISYLIKEQVPATLFINKRWIDENKEIFLELATNDLFQIENHGTDHRPLSVNGKTAWGIKGTESPEEVMKEIRENKKWIKELTGRTPTLFRSGTAYYDEVAVQIAQDLGVQVVNYDILGDAGATFSSEQVKNALLGSEAGSIALLHMNRPESGTREGVKEAVPLLREKGFRFVKIESFSLE